VAIDLARTPWSF